MRIETDRLILRNYKMTDLQDYVKLMTQEKVANRAGFNLKNNDRLLRELKGETENEHKFAIVLKDTDKVIGEIGFNWLTTTTRESLFEIEKGQSLREVEFCLSEEHWGKGYMTEALMALVKVGFEVMLLDLIVAASFIKNFASKKVQVKCGLIPYKTDKNYVWRETGESCKIILSKITKEQYKHIESYKKLNIKVSELSNYEEDVEWFRKLIESSSDIKEL